MQEVVLLVAHTVRVDDDMTIAELKQDWPFIIDDCTISEKLVDINPDFE